MYKLIKVNYQQYPYHDWALFYEVLNSDGTLDLEKTKRIADFYDKNVAEKVVDLLNGKYFVYR